MTARRPRPAALQTTLVLFVFVSNPAKNAGARRMKRVQCCHTSRKCHHIAVVRVRGSAQACRAPEHTRAGLDWNLGTVLGAPVLPKRGLEMFPHPGGLCTRLAVYPSRDGKCFLLWK